MDLEGRATNAACLVSTAVVLVILVELAWVGAARVNLVVVGAATAVLAGLYVAGRFMRQTAWVSWCYLLTSYSLVLYDWNWVGAQHGLALPIFICMAAVLPIILRQGQIRVGYATLALLAAGLWGILLGFPEKFPMVPPSRMAAPEKLFEVSVLAIGLTALTYHTKVSFLRRRHEVVVLNGELERQNGRLREALAEVKTLRGIVPICAHCKRVRNDQGFYESVEKYMSRHSELEFSHGFCPECAKRYYGDLVDD